MHLEEIQKEREEWIKKGKPRHEEDEADSEIDGDKLGFALYILRLIEVRAACKFPEGRNRHLKAIRLSIDPVCAACFPILTLRPMGISGAETSGDAPARERTGWLSRGQFWFMGSWRCRVGSRSRWPSHTATPSSAMASSSTSCAFRPAGRPRRPARTRAGARLSSSMASESESVHLSALLVYFGAFTSSHE